MVDNNININNKTGRNYKIDTLMDNINDTKYQNKLIKTYCKKVIINKNKNKIIKEIMKINNDMNKRILIKDKRVGVRWKIIKMRYSNMFSYGENNEIDFTKMKGIIGIIAPNHYGKSSLLDVIMYCLFDECSRGKMSRDILGVKICECDNRIGENCECCYSSKGTKPCLGRYCGDCGIEECFARVVEKSNE